MPSGARVRMVARLVMNGGGGENGGLYSYSV